MLGRIDLKDMEPRQRADFIYTNARTELSGRLWRAALGDSDSGGAASLVEKADGGFDLGSLIALLAPERTQAAPPPAAAQPQPQPALQNFADEQPQSFEGSDVPMGAGGTLALGANAPHAAAIERASGRTGIPSTALAAIVDAEAAKGADSRWNPYSRNPRSSAAGLGQFLSSTWVGEAQRSGTWLNATARAKGWLDDGGRVLGGARSALLSLRYDAEASIQATADYAKNNMDRMRGAGVQVGDDVKSIAQAAYLGHHLGLGDAIKFMKGGLNSSRARLLLNAQVGAASATRRIAEAGDAVNAHRAWLLGYVGKRIQPAKFSA